MCAQISRYAETSLIEKRSDAFLKFCVTDKTKIMNKLYVGNLPYNTSEDALQAHFEQAGSVTSVAIITDKFSGRSRGFGFVEMGSDDEAQKAIEMLDGQDFEGRNLKVNISKPREER